MFWMGCFSFYPPLAHIVFIETNIVFWRIQIHIEHSCVEFAGATDALIVYEKKGEIKGIWSAWLQKAQMETTKCHFPTNLLHLMSLWKSSVFELSIMFCLQI